MGRVRWWSAVILAVSLWVPGVGRADEGDRRIAQAEAADRALRRDPQRLRFRHHIERVVRLWQKAARHAEGPAKHRAEAGEVRALELLAHWSGLSEDRRRAAARRAALSSKPSGGAPVRDRGAPRISVDSDGTLRVVNGPSSPSIRSAVLAANGRHPPRLYFDLSPMRLPKAHARVLDVSHPKLRRVRLGQPAPNRVRVVLDLADAGARVSDMVKLSDGAYQWSVGDDRIRLALETQAAAADRPGVAPSAARPTQKAPDRRTAPPPARRVAREDAERGRLPLVVVDAGHGGRDSGAVAPSGLKEKQVTLKIARALKETLESRKIARVRLTREGDRYVSLERRTEIANALGADLMVSVHANSHRKHSVRGIETYYLNRDARHYSRRLAARERRRGGGESVDKLSLILADFEMRNSTEQSRDLARQIQSSAVRQLRGMHRDVRDLGVKNALFYVLLGTEMPSVLIETGFLTNPVERRRLSSRSYQRALARSMADGIEKFLRRRVRKTWLAARSGG